MEEEVREGTLPRRSAKAVERRQRIIGEAFALAILSIFYEVILLDCFMMSNTLNTSNIVKTIKNTRKIFSF